jgi:hypothetical protein
MIFKGIEKCWKGVYIMKKIIDFYKKAWIEYFEEYGEYNYFMFR